MERLLFFDTNALLNLQEHAFKEKFVIAQKTLEEIEGIKTSGTKDGETKLKARKLAHLLDEHFEDYEVVFYGSDIFTVLHDFNLEEKPDNIILASAYYYNECIHPIVFCTDDINCKFISKKIFQLTTKGINEINLIRDMEEYTGYKDVIMSDEEMSEFYCNLNQNKYGLLCNEYLIIRNSTSEIVDYRRWNGTEHVALSYKQLNTKFMGRIKPLNPQQVLAFDMLQNKTETIKVISGPFGSGKDAIGIANALKLIEEGKYEKMLYVRNAIGVKDANEIGFLPGSKEEKLAPYAAPLADHLGGQTGLELQIMQGNIEIEHLGYMRGRDIKNTIVYCTEAENLTKEHVQLLIGRIGEGSTLWMNGDFKQTDSSLFRINSGLMTAVERLSGHERFGYVQLQKTERSETAAMADLLD